MLFKLVGIVLVVLAVAVCFLVCAMGPDDKF